jgi:threonine synthase
MLLTPQSIELSAEWTNAEELEPLLESFRSRWEPNQPWDAEASDRLIFIARQILLDRRDGVLTNPETADVLAAAAQLSRRKEEKESADEGVIQEAG